jgi:hypothetical protein
MQAPPGLYPARDSRNDPPVAYYVRYFAAQPLTTKGIQQALQAIDPSFRVDLGELLRGDVRLGEIEVNAARGDLFEDDLRVTLQAVEATGHGHAVIPRLRASSAIVVVNLDWQGGDPSATLRLVEPLWTALAQLSPGLSQWDGHGIYDNGQQVVSFGQG